MVLASADEVKEIFTMLTPTDSIPKKQRTDSFKIVNSKAFIDIPAYNSGALGKHVSDPRQEPTFRFAGILAEPLKSFGFSEKTGHLPAPTQSLTFCTPNSKKQKTNQQDTPP